MMTQENMQTIQQGTPIAWLLDYVANKGLPLSRICAGLGVEDAVFTQNQGAVSPRILNQVFEFCAQELQNPDLAIEMAQALDPLDFGLLSYLVNNSATLKESLKLFEHYLCIFDPENTYKTEFSRQYGRIFYQETLFADIPNARQDIDFSIAIVFRLVRDQLPEHYALGKVCFTYPEPEDMSVHSALFGSGVLFNQAQNYIEFPAADLEQNITGADHKLYEILKVQADAMVDQLSIKQSIIDKVKLLIIQYIGENTLNTELIAEQLHMSVRNLHRQLTDKGTSFQLLRDEVLLALAKQALTNSDRHITDIALELGYSESSSFVRVFKRLAGITPLQFRKKHKM